MATPVNIQISQRKAAVNRFFTRTPKPPSYTNEYVLLGLGGAGLLIFVFAIGAAASQNAAALGGCCGLVFAIAGAVAVIMGLVKMAGKRSAYNAAYALAEPKPPASYVRELLLADLQRIEPRALNALGIDADDLMIEAEVSARLRQIAIAAGQISEADHSKHPVIIVGPARGTRVAQDPEFGTLLFERCAVSVICPTASQFSVYDCILYLDAGGIGIEETLQYPYNHVAAVSTISTAWSIPRQNEKVEPLQANYDVALDEMELQYLKIQVSAGSAAEISCGLVNRTDRQTLVSSLTPQFADAVDTVRAALRQRGALGQSGRDAFSS